MSTTLYYFSATGNSLTTAKLLVAQLEDCRLVPVTSTKNFSKVVDESDSIGCGICVKVCLMNNHIYYSLSMCYTFGIVYRKYGGCYEQ